MLVGEWICETEFLIKTNPWTFLPVPNTLLCVVWPVGKPLRPRQTNTRPRRALFRGPVPLQTSTHSYSGALGHMACTTSLAPHIHYCRTKGNYRPIAYRNGGVGVGAQAESFVTRRCRGRKRRRDTQRVLERWRLLGSRQGKYGKVIIEILQTNSTCKCLLNQPLLVTCKPKKPYTETFKSLSLYVLIRTNFFFRV